MTFGLCLDIITDTFPRIFDVFQNCFPEIEILLFPFIMRNPGLNRYLSDHVKDRFMYERIVEKDEITAENTAVSH